MVQAVLQHLPNIGRRKKRLILIVHDLLAMVVALWAAFSTRLGVPYWPADLTIIASAVASFVVGLFALYRLGIYHIVLRYFDLRTVTRLLSAAVISAVAWAMIVYLTRQQITVEGARFLVPRSVAFIYCGFLFLLVFMGRYVMALLLAGADRDDVTPAANASKVVIYGANATGIALADSMRGSAKHRLVAFVDSDKALRGQLVGRVPIYGPDVLPRLVAEGAVDEVFLAMPKATRSLRLAAISQVRNLGLNVKTVPGPEEIVSGRFSVTDIRPIDVTDLLRRDPVEPIGELICEAVQDHAILVTGAGGSIGSEICRQVFLSRPARLVLLDHSEFAVYRINEQLLELGEKHPDNPTPEVVPIVGSMLNDHLVRHILSVYEIDTLFHAAAYKHVPLLENNELVAVENNVFGTLAVARAAFDANLTRFTMISTDKAVRPKSVMGASKRVAELLVQALANKPNCRTRFGIVRFGNVLDSSGSVIQRFRRQILGGGPITVTHREITRFFMSIPEATQLVLQASAMAQRGEVFVLDMGEPVQITDLAKHMVNLSGMTIRDEENPHGDIEISFIGLRPGEKLFEELFLGDTMVDTIHPRIKMSRERIIVDEQLQPMLDALRDAVETRDCALVRRRLGAFIADEGHESGFASKATMAYGTDG